MKTISDGTTLFRVSDEVAEAKVKTGRWNYKDKTAWKEYINANPVPIEIKQEDLAKKNKKLERRKKLHDKQR